ncbi:MAG: 4-hydroxy-3-methylbut-2-enyl diphosphate reductase, partial [Clostridia bacterium]|nr:4-hydroxy-3-methylbut-2-enyl diphosphate reductase [Clostridia bacterium]
MQITIADNAGFCFGVDRAVRIAYDTAKDITKNPVYTYGMIIHNNDVVKELEALGVKCAETIDEIPEESTVIIRAHGISKSEYDQLKSINAEIIDATCPYVKKIHQVAQKESEKGQRIVIVGDKNHPEVKGINGWCGNEA